MKVLRVKRVIEADLYRPQHFADIHIDGIAPAAKIGENPSCPARHSRESAE